MVKIIFIEGIIGAGKTTFIEKLKQNNNKRCLYIQEPVEEWKSSGMLEKFYSNIKLYAFEFQLYVLKSLANQFENLDTSMYDYIIVERSIYSSYYIFGEMLYNDNYISKIDFNILTNQFNELITKNNLFAIDNIMFVWLNTSIDICMERIAIRNRVNEKDKITFDYQSQLLDQHLKFFILFNDNVITLDQLTILLN